MTIKETAQAMLDNLEFRKRDEDNQDDDSGRWVMKEIIDWQSNIIMAAHGDRFPNDHDYRFVVEALQAIVDTDADTEEEARDAVYELEPDVYTSQLTQWLDSNNSNVYYLTEALEEFADTDGFRVLAQAQLLRKQEVGTAILDGIVAYLAEEVTA